MCYQTKFKYISDILYFDGNSNPIKSWKNESIFKWNPKQHYLCLGIRDGFFFKISFVQDNGEWKDYRIKMPWCNISFICCSKSIAHHQVKICVKACVPAIVQHRILEEEIEEIEEKKDQVDAKDDNDEVKEDEVKEQGDEVKEQHTIVEEIEEIEEEIQEEDDEEIQEEEENGKQEADADPSEEEDGKDDNDDDDDDDDEDIIMNDNLDVSTITINCNGAGRCRAELQRMTSQLASEALGNVDEFFCDGCGESISISSSIYLFHCPRGFSKRFGHTEGFDLCEKCAITAWKQKNNNNTRQQKNPKLSWNLYKVTFQIL